MPLAKTNSRRHFVLRYRVDGVTLVDNKGNEIGAIDEKHGRALKSLKIEAQSLRCDAYVVQPVKYDSASIKRDGLSTEIHVYGNTQDMQLIGNRLFEAAIFLQEPVNMGETSDYHNPHVYSLEYNHQTPLFRHQEIERLKDIQQQVDDIIYASDNKVYQEVFEIDHRIKSTLCRSVALRVG